MNGREQGGLDLTLKARVGDGTDKIDLSPKEDDPKMWLSQVYDQGHD